jgi:hypothetical protein
MTRITVTLRGDTADRFREIQSAMQEHRGHSVQDVQVVREMMARVDLDR